VVQVPGGKGDNHREHWILAPEGCGGLLFPRPLPDGNLRPPFDDPKFEERPPYLAEVMKPKPPPDEGQAKPAPGGGQAKPSKPEPAPPASPRRGRAAMRAASVTRKESGTAPEALATHAYLLEDDSVEARVVHFTLGCPALKSASLEPAAVALGGLKLVDDAASMEAFGRPACGTCKRMMAAGPAREIGRFSDAKAELVIYDDRIASFDRGQDEDSLPVAVRLADVESFTISGFFAARALFITVDGDHLFEFNPEDKQELEAARNALLEVEIPERSSWF
jgi:hypothetical protein